MAYMIPAGLLPNPRRGLASRRTERTMGRGRLNAGRNERFALVRGDGSPLEDVARSWF